jgi:hypothetical protein
MLQMSTSRMAGVMHMPGSHEFEAAKSLFAQEMCDILTAVHVMREDVDQIKIRGEHSYHSVSD